MSSFWDQGNLGNSSIADNLSHTDTHEQKTKCEQVGIGRFRSCLTPCYRAPTNVRNSHLATANHSIKFHAFSYKLIWGHVYFAQQSKPRTGNHSSQNIQFFRLYSMRRFVIDGKITWKITHTERSCGVIIAGRLRTKSPAPWPFRVIPPPPSSIAREVVVLLFSLEQLQLFGCLRFSIPPPALPGLGAMCYAATHCHFRLWRMSSIQASLKNANLRMKTLFR